MTRISLKLSGIAVAASLIGGAATAATITIDDFSTGQFNGAPSMMPFILDNSQVMGGGILGDYRDIAVTSTNFSTFATTQSNIDNGVAEISTNPATIGTVTYTWDGDDDPLSVNTGGLGGLDLTGGGMNSLFSLSVISSDLVGNAVDLTVWSIGGGMATVSSSIVNIVDDAVDPAQLLTFDFSSFGGVDLMNVGAIQMFYETTEAQDLVFDNLVATAPVPLPAGGALLLTGLGALVVARRKKRSDA